MQAPEPGTYPNVPFAEYLSWECCSHSQLENMKRSAAYCEWRRLHPLESTDAMKIGSAIHTATLEPEKFDDLYIMRPTGNATKLEKNGGCKEAYDAVKASGKILLTEDEMLGCYMAAGQIQSHQVFGPILSVGLKELSCVADIDGLRVKVRFDCYDANTGAVIDIKKTIHASEEMFPREVSRYGHHRQAALYGMVAIKLGLPMNVWYWAAIQASAPYEMNPMECENEALELGYAQNKILVARYAECLLSGKWGGFPQDIKKVGVAAWETDAEDEFEMEEAGE